MQERTSVLNEPALVNLSKTAFEERADRRRKSRIDITRMQFLADSYKENRGIKHYFYLFLKKYTKNHAFLIKNSSGETFPARQIFETILEISAFTFLTEN